MTNTTHLRELIERATKGPWKHYNEVFRPQFGKRRVTEIQPRWRGKAIVNWQGFDGDQARKANANAAMIVALVNQAPAMLDELDALRGRVSDSVGLFLAVGIILSDPPTEANRKHLARCCMQQAETLCPGVVPEHYRAALKQGTPT